MEKSLSPSKLISGPLMRRPGRLLQALLFPPSSVRNQECVCGPHTCALPELSECKELLLLVLSAAIAAIPATCAQCLLQPCLQDTPGTAARAFQRVKVEEVCCCSLLCLWTPTLSTTNSTLASGITSMGIS